MESASRPGQARAAVRYIRLLLMEHVEGVCMRNLCYGGSSPAPADFTEEYRLEILARILDSYTRMQHAGVDQNDLVPRNLILVLDGPQVEGSPRAVTRIVLIDYNFSLVHHLSAEWTRYCQVTELPRNLGESRP